MSSVESVAGSQARRRLAGVLTGVVVVVGLAVMDLLSGPGPQYIGVLTCAPLVTASLAGPRGTAAISALAIAVGVGLGPVGSELDTAQLVRLALIGAAGIVAVLLAAQRVGYERRLEQVTTVATIAQQTILRPTEAVLGRFRFATRYQSATSEASIGGDLFEVLQTPWGVRVLLGDVRGKGLGAVQIAAFTLGAFREAAFGVGPDLRGVAAQVARSAERWLDTEDFVTALFLELHEDGTGVMVSCGHAPPLRQRPGGLVDELETGEPQPPIGLLSRPRAERFDLSEGDRLLLYTDGLSEARDARGAFFEIPPVLQRHLGLPVERVAEALLVAAQAHAGKRRHDDVALVVVDVLARPRAALPGRHPAAEPDAIESGQP